MSAPDAETYLRCRIEDALVAGPEPAWESLVYRVRAALAIGVITDGVAEELLADAERAFAIRGEDDFDADTEDEYPQPPRVVACPTVIEQDWGTLVISHATFAARETTFGVTGTMRGAQVVPSRRRRDFWDEVEIVDSAGATHHARFSGGSSGSSFDGEYSVHPSLDPASTSVTIAGHRIDLADPPPPPAIRIDDLPGLSALDRARRHLELVAGSAHWGDHYGARAAHETLTDLGLDVADEPAVGTARPGRAPGTARPAPVPGRRGRRGSAAARFLAIGATTPPVDGLVITLSALTDGGRLSISGTAHGRINVEQHWPPPVHVRAVDDLGTHYTCDHDNGGGGGDSFQSTVRLVPALDLHATLLTITLDTLCHRILIDVPLEWREPR